MLLVITFAGLACLAGAYFNGMSTWELVTSGIRTQGSVIDVQQEIISRNAKNSVIAQQVVEFKYTPLVRFTDNAQNIVDFRDHTSDSWPRYKKGDNVRVIYLERAPFKTATIDQGAGNWTFSFILAAIGMLFIGFAATAYLMTKRQAK